MTKYFTRHKEEFLEWHYRKVEKDVYCFYIDSILIGQVINKGELGWSTWDFNPARSDCSKYFETRRMASLYLLAKQGYRTN